jgi:hypothetical protein
MQLWACKWNVIRVKLKIIRTQQGKYNCEVLYKIVDAAKLVCDISVAEKPANLEL